MKALEISSEKNIILTDIPALGQAGRTAGATATPGGVAAPQRVAPGYLWIRISACGINPGDAALIGGRFAPGSIPTSLYNVGGGSAVGEVIELGEGVPDRYRHKKVAIYRSLQFGDQIIGTWSEYAHMPYRSCLILPDKLDEREYSGSLVNVLTAYSFVKQIQRDGHKGIINTAGSSASGLAMVGVCQELNIPLINIVRNAASRTDLENLGTRNVLVSDEADFLERLTSLSAELSTTAVFDGVGGELLTTMMGAFPAGTGIYCYGFLGGAQPFSFHTVALMRNISIQAFFNFKTPTASDPAQLDQALADIGAMIHLPHFKTVVGKEFSFEQVNEALQYKGKGREKAVLIP